MSSLNNIFSNDITEFTQYKNKVLYEMATDKTGKIEYKMNEHGYRSKPLKGKHDMNILTLGCSWTMGVGVDNDKIWPSMIGKQFDNSIVFNYGMYGVSCSFISKLCYKILHSGIVPDLILVMWPGFSRRDYINKDGEYRKIGGFRMAHNDDVVWRNREEDLNFLELQNDYQDINEFWLSYKFLESLCNNFGIKVHHTIVGYYYEIFEKHYEYLKSFIDEDNFFIPKSVYKNDLKAVDGEHPSERWHKEFSDEFFRTISNKKK